ncbi:signal element on autosome protein 2 [Eupeodes corollae]|uniref:signal element on autosome protein 2 n=1 Tax=Eupeodes corollae TaxID=290404 RepID=UPI0024907E24|nr:signal element on autosome protein 2 [Eupeodes corollae]
MIFVVGFLWLMMALMPIGINAIQVSPEAGLRNASSAIMRTTEGGFIPINMAFTAPNRTLGTEMSASERTRRLIPYVAYYSPSQTEFPINQQYVVQMTPPSPSKQQLHYQSPQKSQKQQHMHSPAAAAAAASSAIPLPTAYVHMKVPINNQHQLQIHHQQQQQLQSHAHHNHHHSPQAVFQTIAYGGQHPPTQLKEKSKLAVKVPQLQHSIVPPAPPAVGGATQQQRILYPHNTYNKEDSLSLSKQFHSQKINMTPFTPTNSVPGRFIPIVYTNEQQQNNNINYKTPGTSSSIDLHEQQQQQQQHQLHHQQQQRYQQQHLHQQQLHLYNDLPSIGQSDEQHQQLQHLQSHPSGSVVGHKQQQLNPEDYHRHRPQGEIVVTIPASPLPSSELVVPKTLSQVPPQQQDNRQHEHVQYVTISTPGPPSSPSYRIISDLPTENRHQHQQHQLHQQQHQHQVQQQHQQQYEQQQQFPNTDNLTPQQKYVNYLRQQLRYKQQQQLQEHHHQDEKNLQHPHHYQIQQQQQQQQQNHHLYSYDLGTTANPVHSPSLSSSSSLSASSSTASQHPSTTQSVDVHPENHHHHNQNRFNEKYPQHSPINHVVYQPSEVLTDPEQILHPSSNKHSHHHHSHRYNPLPSPSSTSQPPQQQHQLQSHQYASNPNKYIEYIIDDPKQEIEEHSTSQEKDHQQQRQGIRPPPMILVGNSRPAPPPVEVVVSSPRPLYKNQPTLRLHAISPTPRPEVIFVSSKPKHTQLSPTVSPIVKPIKLKPSQQYPTPDHPLPPPSTSPKDVLPDLKTLSLAEILRKLQESNHLPQTLTPDNIDNSIRTLIRILHNLKGSQTIVDDPPQHHEQDYDYNNNEEDEGTPAQQDLSLPGAKPGPNSGRPGIDYPTLDRIPVTSFDCQQQRYKGFFGDPETNCQVWHYCDLNGGKASFLCPNGTIFSQIALTCDWWFNVKCATTPQLYVLNERLYKYILPFTPKFPEDYSGPLVDKYLALKFKEMEDKMNREKLKGRGGNDDNNENDNENNDTEDSIVDDVTQGPIEHGNTPKKKPDQSDGLIGEILSTVGEQSSEKNLLIDEETGRIASRAQGEESSAIEQTTKELPLSQQPIVVSTTELPFGMGNGESPSSSSVSNDPPTMMGDKVSVEKVEVIEIKSDGTSGHLIPESSYSPVVDT